MLITPLSNVIFNVHVSLSLSSFVFMFDYIRKVINFSNITRTKISIIKSDIINYMSNIINLQLV